MPESNPARFLVIDDHEAILAGTVPALQGAYPQAAIATAKDMRAAQQELARHLPDLVIVDLSLPESSAGTASAEVGMRLIDSLISSEQAPNIMVLSTNVKPLVRLKPVINAYGGGFVALDKSAPIEEMLHSVEIALRGSTHLPPELRKRPEFDRKWLTVLKLKYQKGFSDRAIAKEMGISDRTVRNYWVRIQDSLGIHESPDLDLRVQIRIAARRAGLISLE
ncbi:MAG: response regulator transcription factor [Cyanobacteria bacterium P01_D01_bin.105]